MCIMRSNDSDSNNGREIMIHEQAKGNINSMVVSAEEKSVVGLFLDA